MLLWQANWLLLIALGSQAADPNLTCMSHDLARRCLVELRTQEDLQQELTLQKQLAASQVQEVVLLKQQIAADDLMVNDWRSKALASEDQLQQSQGSLHAWYHNPLYLTLGGFTLGVAATTVIVVLLNR